MNKTDLTRFQESILREIGSVSAAHAATALAKVTGREIKVKPTRMLMVPLSGVYQFFAGRSDLDVGIFVRMLGNISGGMLFFQLKSEAYPMIDMVRGDPIGTTKVLGDMEQSILREVGNTILGAYLNAISDMSHQVLSMTVPKLVLDQGGRILYTILKQLFPDETLAIMVENAFTEKDHEVNGFFLLVPDKNDMKVLLDMLETSVRCPA